jgi:hypothetical protein
MIFRFVLNIYHIIRMEKSFHLTSAALVNPLVPGPVLQIMLHLSSDLFVPGPLFGALEF